MPTEVFEEVLEIVSYMTFFSPTISLDMWSLWPLMMEALADWAIDFFPSMVLNYILTLLFFFSLLVHVRSLDNLWMAHSFNDIKARVSWCLNLNLKTNALFFSFFFGG